MEYRKISVVIPAYNEEGTIRDVVSRVKSVELPLGLEKEIVVVKDEFRGWPNLSETQKMSGQEAATYVKSLRTHEKPNNGSTYRFKAYESAVVLEIKGSDDFGRFTRKITVCPTREA